VIDSHVAWLVPQAFAQFACAVALGVLIAALGECLLASLCSRS